MDAMETETETYDTIMKKCLATMLDKLTTKMPTAGETERDMLAALWEDEVDKDEALDVGARQPAQGGVPACATWHVCSSRSEHLIDGTWAPSSGSSPGEARC